MTSKLLVVIAGPTAVGKTRMAISLARQFNSVILSADSRQFYRGMDIGTAKPTESELQKAPHYFIDSLDVKDTYSVGDFERDALRLLNELLPKQNPVFMVGGSGLYIKAVCDGLNTFPPIDAEVKQTLEVLYETGGIEALQLELKKADPEYYQEVDLNNPHRLLRALAVFQSSGKRFSFFRKKQQPARPFKILRICLVMDRQKLYDRINRRVDDMINSGLIEEARNFYSQKKLNALQTVGYQELFEHFDGTNSLEKAIELIKQNTRRYAKRQMTWFRNQGNWHYLDPFDEAGCAKLIEEKLANDLETRN